MDSEHLGELVGSRYRIAARIGAGGMGVVYRAQDEQLHRSVAIKILPDDVGHDVDRLARFKNEARALSALNHPNIVTIYEVGAAGAVPFIAMELVEGQTLRERLRTGGLAMRDALDVSLQVGRALAAAHEKRIVHCDIKPDNVMIRRDGYAKVLDFGLAGLRAALESERSVVSTASFATVGSAVAGTPAYMSPEQIEGAPLDSRTDVFSLGVMLCEAATGVNPFARSNALETMSAIGQTPTPALPLTNDLPPQIGAVVVKAIQRDPAARYQTAADLVADLQRILTGLDAPLSVAGRRGLPRRYVVATTLILAVLAGAGALAYRQSERRHWVREQAVPRIESLASEEKSATAFSLIQTASQILPDDPVLAHAIDEATSVATIHSTPPGAIVEVKDYRAPNEAWLRLGVTPLEKIRIPSGYLRWKVTKDGIGESITAPFSTDSLNFDLAAAAKAPKGMVRVDAGTMVGYFGFLGALGPYDLPPFFIDQFEVTNRRYQEFVDQGGYAKREYWKQTFSRDGRELAWTDAMDLFRDSTGRPGPATWEAGRYPEGKGDYPVTGVSWYEAAAYAEFAGKSLPVIAQTFRASPEDSDKFVLQLSNPSVNLAPVGQFKGLGLYGTYDLVGNAREWDWNGAGGNLRYSMGRQANSYGPEALPSFDRSPLNGFRCVINTAPLPAGAVEPHLMFRRDFSKTHAVGDDVFKIYRNMYAYDKSPLHASVETVPDVSGEWTKQKITFDAAYSAERVPAFLFLPKDVRPPFQAVVFFPSARVNGLPSSNALGDLTFVDYVIKSGRAVIYPIYESMYERRSKSGRTGGMRERETVVDWSKDLGRAIDYLETRPDIDKTRIAYLGVSQGAADGVILAAVEDRLKAVVLLDGGYFQEPNPVPGLDQVDFAPRLTKPVLMVNGRYDATFPLDTAQDPLFRAFGTHDADKRHIVFDTPHDVRFRRSDLVKEVLAWLDTYIGRVN